MTDLKWVKARDLPNPMAKIISDTERAIHMVVELKNKELIKSVEEQRKRSI